MLSTGAVYHVTARTNKKELLLESPLAKTLFLETLARAKAKHCFEIDNFVIMGNHFHLLIRPTGNSSLAEILKWTLGVYSMAHHRIYKQWGHLWGSRYFSRPIGSFGEYLEVYRYIDNNPVAAGLVDLASQWPWGGLGHDLARRSDIVTAPLWWRGVVSSRSVFPLGLPGLGSVPQ